MSTSAKQTTANQARISRMGHAWLEQNPDGQLRRAVAGILWWDYPQMFARPAESMLVDCDAVDSSHLRAALSACGYGEWAASTRSHRPVSRNGYGNPTKYGGCHKRMIGRAGTESGIGLWGMPWTDGNSRAPIHRGAFA